MPESRAFEVAIPGSSSESMLWPRPLIYGEANHLAPPALVVCVCVGWVCVCVLGVCVCVCV
jgi:hypothetical protein